METRLSSMHGMETIFTTHTCDSVGKCPGEPRVFFNILTILISYPLFAGRYLVRSLFLL